MALEVFMAVRCRWASEGSVLTQPGRFNPKPALPKTSILADAIEAVAGRIIRFDRGPVVRELFLPGCQSSSGVEQRTHKPLVGGSIPSSGTT